MAKNPVAKNINKINRPSTHTDKSKEDKPIKEDLMEAAKIITSNRYSSICNEEAQP